MAIDRKVEAAFDFRRKRKAAGLALGVMKCRSVPLIRDARKPKYRSKFEGAFRLHTNARWQLRATEPARQKILSLLGKGPDTNFSRCIRRMDDFGTGVSLGRAVKLLLPI